MTEPPKRNVFILLAKCAQLQADTIVMMIALLSSEAKVGSRDLHVPF